MISIAKVQVWHEWKFAEGVRQGERAVTVSPNNAEAHWVWAGMPVVGRCGSIESVRTELDPLRVSISVEPGCCCIQGLRGGDPRERDLRIDEKYGRGFVFMGPLTSPRATRNRRSIGSSAARASTPRFARTMR
jgi:hypothetical protein